MENYHHHQQQKNYKPDSGFEHLVYWGKLEMKTAIAFAATYKIVICCIKQATSHYVSTNDKHTTKTAHPVSMQRNSFLNSPVICIISDILRKTRFFILFRFLLQLKSIPADPQQVPVEAEMRNWHFFSAGCLKDIAMTVTPSDVFLPDLMSSTHQDEPALVHLPIRSVLVLRHETVQTQYGFFQHSTLLNCVKRGNSL